MGSITRILVEANRSAGMPGDVLRTRWRRWPPRASARVSPPTSRQSIAGHTRMLLVTVRGRARSLQRLAVCSFGRRCRLVDQPHPPPQLSAAADHCVSGGVIGLIRALTSDMRMSRSQSILQLEAAAGSGARRKIAGVTHEVPEARFPGLPSPPLLRLPDIKL